MTIRILLMSLLPLLSFAQSNSKVAMPKNTQSNDKGPVEIKRNTLYNLDEIKVRWKKAALENCSGVPCVVTPPPPSFTCGTSTIRDFDGNIYNTVSIGTQCWLRENLRVRRYNDGTEIRFDNSGTSSGNSSQTWGETGIGTGRNFGAYTIYAHDSTATPSNLTSQGYLYNWYAVAGIVTSGGVPNKKICPTGWHVPTDSDWNTLVKFIDSGADTSATSTTQSTSAGGKMKSTSSLWNPASPGTDNFNFSALPGGFRYYDGSFNNIRNNAFFWSATEINTDEAWSRYLYFDQGSVRRGSNFGSDKKGIGASVRCLKD